MRIPHHTGMIQSTGSVMSMTKSRRSRIRNIRSYIARDEAAALSERHSPKDVALLEQRMRQSRLRLAELELEESNRKREMTSLRNFIIRDESVALSERCTPAQVALLRERMRQNKARLAELENKG